MGCSFMEVEGKKVELIIMRAELRAIISQTIEEEMAERILREN